MVTALVTTGRSDSFWSAVLHSRGPEPRATLSPDYGAWLRHVSSELQGGTKRRKGTGLQQNTAAQGGDLATALASFLDQWTHKQEPTPRPRAAQDGALAKQLIAVLKECINRHASDEEVAKEVRAQLLCSPQADPTPARSNPVRRVAVRTEKSPAHEVPRSEWRNWESSGWRDYSGWQDWDDWPSGHNHDYESYWDGWHEVPAHNSHASSRSSQKYCAHTDPYYSKEARVVAVSPAEWNAEVRLGTVQQMLECIRAGRPCETNVVYTDTPEDIGMLKTAWSAFAVQGGLTVIAGGSAKHLEQLFLTRLRLTRRKSAPRIEDVGLLALGSNSPWIQPPKVVSQSRITTVQRMTVRISVPEHYRCLYHDAQKDCVKDVLADLALTAGVRSH